MILVSSILGFLAMCNAQVLPISDPLPATACIFPDGEIGYPYWEFNGNGNLMEKQEAKTCSNDTSNLCPIAYECIHDDTEQKSYCCIRPIKNLCEPMLGPFSFVQRNVEGSPRACGGPGDGPCDINYICLENSDEGQKYCCFNDTMPEPPILPRPGPGPISMDMSGMTCQCTCSGPGVPPPIPFIPQNSFPSPGDSFGPPPYPNNNNGPYENYDNFGPQQSFENDNYGSSFGFDNSFGPPPHPNNHGSPFGGNNNNKPPFDGYNNNGSPFGGNNNYEPPFGSNNNNGPRFDGDNSFGPPSFENYNQGQFENGNFGPFTGKK